MPTYAQVAAAAELGMLTAEPDVPTAAVQALRVLAEVLHSDAASLVAVDPVDRTHHQIAGIEYLDETAGQLAVQFVSSQWFSDVLDSDLPPSISQEHGQSFRRGWFYEQHVAPAGFRDGMTGALRRSQRYIGLVHLSSSRAGTYDAASRRLLKSVLPALAALADTHGHLGRHNDPPSGHAALVADDTVIDMPNLPRPVVLQDGSFRHLVEEFAASGGSRLRLLWPADGRWHRVILEAAPASGRPHRVVLVRSDPVDIPYRLSPRELDVLTQLAVGLSNQAIADSLFISPRTVHTHIEHLLQKTGTTTRAQAAGLAMRESVVHPLPGSPTRAGTRSFIER